MRVCATPKHLLRMCHAGEALLKGLKTILVCVCWGGGEEAAGLSACQQSFPRETFHHTATLSGFNEARQHFLRKVFVL